MTRMYGDTIVSGAALRCLLGIMGVVSVLTCALSASGEPIPDEDRTITLYQQLAPATVFLSVTHGPAHPFSSSPTTGVGAGFVVDEDGTVVTNAHVVEEARGVMATLYDGRRISAAIVGVDPVSDVAVLQLDAERPPITPVRLGNSDTLRIGQQMLVVGSPFGLGFTLTTGIVSGMGPVRGLPAVPSRLIQTTAPLNPGNSGGPLVDSEGLVVGIATATLAGAQNIGFAIPINTAKQVLTELREKGRVIRPWLGIGGKFVTRDLQRLLRLPLTDGLLVEEVEDDSPAKEAGLVTGPLSLVIDGVPWVLGGDIVVSLQGRPVETAEVFAQVVSQFQVGQEIRIEVMRDGHRLERVVVLRERPRPSPRQRQPRQSIAETMLPQTVQAPPAPRSSF